MKLFTTGVIRRWTRLIFRVLCEFCVSRTLMPAFAANRNSRSTGPGHFHGLGILLLLIAALTLQCDADEPVVRWDFESNHKSAPLEIHGDVTRDQPGPRAPEFPEFTSDNHAVKLNGNGSRLTLADPGENSPFDFRNGDAISLESWVNVESASPNQAIYIIGKGRTNSAGFSRDNQNWSLRIATGSGTGRLSFLFATKPGAGTAHWHRWDSLGAFKLKTGWHHVAVSYHFGNPKSVRGWIDGVPTDGEWSYGGPTTDPPIVDDDEVWIGSSLGGNKGNSLRGLIDNVAIHRRLLTDGEVTARFNRVGGPQVLIPQRPAMPDVGVISAGKVLVTLSESGPSHERWPYAGEEFSGETSRWLADDFLLPRIPLRYDDWGIRTGWKQPLLLRMSADVRLPSGESRILLRARALGRLWIDGKLIAETAAITKDPPNGEERLLPIPQPLVSGMRLPSYRQQEVFGKWKSDADKGRNHRVVLELVVGGPKLRVETGEICVALQTAEKEMFHLLSPARSVPIALTDTAVQPLLAEIKCLLAELDHQTRREAASSEDEFWQRRHEMARERAGQYAKPVIPKSTGRRLHPIDAFIAAKIAKTEHAATAQTATDADHFHEKVLPLLRRNCFRCHGDKAKGGLILNRRDTLLRGGDSGEPGAVAGDPAASEIVARIHSTDVDMRMPPTGRRLSPEEILTIEKWIRDGAAWPTVPVTAADLNPAPLVSDSAFLRRVFLDTVGLPPTQEIAEAFLVDERPDKRTRLIDQLLADERCADNLMGEWLDMLAENPTLLNKSQGSTGPFRFFLHDSLRDNKPLDRMVTELVMMRGGAEEGGSAGFAIAAENDAPFAGKAHILASAFLGVELQCARCHDAPFHDVSQQDLFSLAAMLQRKPASIPGTSSVPSAFFDDNQRQPLIQVSLKPGAAVAVAWPFETITGAADGPAIDQLMHSPADTRERLAALITAPDNHRFPKVIVNRIWKRMMGAGIVEPVHDWEGQSPSHPHLLTWLAHEFITHDYDQRHVMRLIATSDAYQRDAVGENATAAAESRFFASPDRRRLTAEQVVDSLYAAVAAPMTVGELTFVHDGRRALSNRQTLGRPARAWMLASLNNERDRPSLSLPRAQAVTDVLEAFGWTGSRQKPIATRNTEPNLLQPGALANGVLSDTLSRAAAGTALGQLGVDAERPEVLVESLFLRILTRRPKPAERSAFTEILADGFDQRLVPVSEIKPVETPPPLPLVTWFNHLRPNANKIQEQVQRRVRMGPPADPRLKSGWRELYEDVVWSLINHREFVWVP